MSEIFNEMQEPLQENTVEGRNAVTEAIKAGRTIEKIFIVRQSETVRFPGHILAMARENGIPVVQVDRKRLDALSVTRNHQGVVAVVSDKEYSTIDEILAVAAQKGQPPFVLICDHLSDTYNLGAILRTAYIAGVHGVILPKRRSATLSAAVHKASAGAAAHIAVCKVANVSAAIKELQKKGLWVFGADGKSEHTMYQTDFTGPIGLVVGSEDEGVSRLVLENCDGAVQIPMPNPFDSLNASAAAAILLYEAVRQRSAKGI